MHKKQKLLAGLAAMTLFDISAATAAGPDWAGFYIGGHAGFRIANTKLTSAEFTSIVNSVEVPILPQLFDPKGGIFGVQAGYNVMISPTLLAGIEGDFSWGTGRPPASIRDFLDGFYTSQFKLTWQASIRGRLGVTHGAWLIYGTAGVAFTEAKWTNSLDVYNGCCNPVASYSWSARKVLTGAAVGAGVEHMYTKNVILRGEYLFESFGSFSVPYGDVPQIGKVDLDVHKIRFAISYKFGP